MSGDDGRIPVTPERPATVPEGSMPITAWVAPADRAGHHGFFTDQGARFHVRGTNQMALVGIPVPPPPPVKVTLSIGGHEVEVPEADVRWLGAMTTEEFDPRFAPFVLACRAWVAANPEGEKP